MAAQSKALRTKHVLVVDDDPEIVETISAALRSRGMKVSTAFDGNQGIAYAETKAPDLSETQMPIIMITGNEGMRHRKYAELLGVDDYIQKPFTMDRLLQAVSKILDAEQA